MWKIEVTMEDGHVYHETYPDCDVDMRHIQEWVDGNRWWRMGVIAKGHGEPVSAEVTAPSGATTVKRLWATQIQWSVAHEQVSHSDLPEEAVLPIRSVGIDLDEEVTDYLSDTYGWTVEGLFIGWEWRDNDPMDS